MRTYKHDDALGEVSWPEGPWTDEWDKATWVDETTGLDAMIHRNRMGALCGYVGVAEGHPHFRVNYDEVNVEVHGGLTYSAFCEDTTDEAVGLCHVPEPGRPEEVWWLGFDCAHAFDQVPGLLALDLHLDFMTEMHYWTFDEVKAEVENLARQLAEVAA